MRIGVLGDIHGNLSALEAVVEAMRQDSPDVLVQTGDVVGYGAEPGACIDLLRDQGFEVCLGNHDAAALGALDTAYFNDFARAAIDWTKAALRPEDRKWLAALPLVSVQKEFDYTVVHGSLNEPERFDYVNSGREAWASMVHQQTFACFVGHSHVPGIWMLREDMKPGALDAVHGAEVETRTTGTKQILVNVGSVGQPRDEDPRAAYAILDTDKQRVAIKRCVYDIERAQASIRAAGLPRVLADRLALGM